MDEKQKIIRVALIALIAIVLGISAYYYFFSGRGKNAGAGVPPTPAEKSEGLLPGTKEAAPVAPIRAALDRSDAAVRDLIAELSQNPVLAKWLQGKDLIRRFVAAVDNVAGGVSPRVQFDFFVPAGSFKTVVRGGATFLDPASFARYNIVADVFDSVSATGCARAYEAGRELLQQAYRELGYPKGDFHQVLYRAIIEILRTPVVEDAIEVEQGVATYLIKDPKLEELDAVQKHFLRMGPENLQLIQVKLREISLVLGFTDAQLPVPRPYRRNP
jgi:hypothetical protein